MAPGATINTADNEAKETKSHECNPMGLQGAKSHECNPMGLQETKSHECNPMGLQGAKSHECNPMGLQGAKPLDWGLGLCPSILPSLPAAAGGTFSIKTNKL
jgi:hypothetical protein